jgi:hypothetical protein
VTVNISRASSSFTHDVKLTWNGQTFTAASKTASTSVAYTIPTSWGSAIPSASSGVATVTVDTFSGSTKVGTATRQLTVTVPASAAPALGELTAAQVYDALSPAVPSAWGVYVQSRSGVKATLASASGQMGATISKVVISGGGYSVSGTGLVLTTGPVNASGTVTFTATATDSRGRTASKTVSVAFVPYATPTLGSVLSQRANSSSQVASDGTYGLAKATYGIASVSGKNSAVRALAWRQSGASAWTEVPDGFNSGVAKLFGGGGLATNKSYDVRYAVQDAFFTVMFIDQISQSVPPIEIGAGGDRVGILMEPTQPGLNIGGDLWLNGSKVTIPLPPSLGGTGVAGQQAVTPSTASTSDSAPFTVRERVIKLDVAEPVTVPPFGVLSVPWTSDIGNSSIVSVFFYNNGGKSLVCVGHSSSTILLLNPSLIPVTITTTNHMVRMLYRSLDALPIESGGTGQGAPSSASVTGNGLTAAFDKWGRLGQVTIYGTTTKAFAVGDVIAAYPEGFTPQRAGYPRFAAGAPLDASFAFSATGIAAATPLANGAGVRAFSSYITG